MGGIASPIELSGLTFLHIRKVPPASARLKERGGVPVTGGLGLHQLIRAGW